MVQKERLDKLLVQRGFVQTRERAQELIAQRRVFVDRMPAEKPGSLVRPDVSIRVQDDGPQYVSRGALKLAGAHAAFGFEIAGRMVLDVGISTGGFTDYVLQHGALGVVGIDVGYGQLDFRLRQDMRVCLLERTNARQLSPDVFFRHVEEHFGEVSVAQSISLVVMDLSFISVTKVLPHIATFVQPGADFVILIKPQFEAQRHEVGKGGIVTDEGLRQAIFDRVAGSLSVHFDVIARSDSPLSGTKGNRETFFWLRYRASPILHGPVGY